MLQHEEILTFTELAKRIPPIGGKRLHPSTLWRWATRGVNGAKLEACKLGGRYVTSVEALERFGKACAEAGVQEKGPRTQSVKVTSPRGRTDRQRERDLAEADKVLSEAGI